MSRKSKTKAAKKKESRPESRQPAAAPKPVEPPVSSADWWHVIGVALLAGVPLPIWYFGAGIGKAFITYLVIVAGIEFAARWLSFGKTPLRFPWHEDSWLALNLGLLALFRPWRDGITFPYDNAYFVWAIVVLVTCWAARAIWRGEALRFSGFVALSAAFLGIAALMSFNTIQYDSTYRSLLLWSAHFALFLLATNLLRSRQALAIVLGAFAITSFLEAAYGFLHLEYVLPYTRLLVKLDPRLITANFGMAQLSAQLTNRLDSNRAFGSLLFPNALGAFMILGIPYAFGAAVCSGRRLRAEVRTRQKAPNKETREQRLALSAAVGLVVWFAAVLLSYLLFFILSTYKYFHLEGVGRQTPVSDPFTAHLGVWIVTMGVVPLIPGIAALCVTRVYGGAIAWLSIRLCCAGALALSELFTLYLTFSRGATLGLAFALAAAAFLLWYASDRGARLRGVRVLSRILAPTAVVLMVWCAATGGGFARAASQATTSSPAGAHSGPATSAGASQIIVQGKKRHLTAVFNTTSVHLRLSYWKTGLYMIEDHFLTGVGLGNFGVAYPIYQYLGSGDVKMAHNDYLQMFCETGVFGFLAFVGFWGCFVISGARRIVAEPNPPERWMLAGLYTGVLAFLFHSGVDFNFFNTSLAFYAFLLAGAFLSWQAPRQVAVRQNWIHQVAILLILAVAWLVAGAQLRVRPVDRVLSNHRLMYDKPAMANDFLRKIAKFNPQNPPRFNQLEIAQLIPDLADQESFGEVLVAVKPTMYRPLKPGEAIPTPMIAQPILEVRDPGVATGTMHRAIDKWVSQLEQIDASYPHSPVMAAYIYRWCEIQADTIHNREYRNRWILKSQEWGEKAVHRSPQEYWLRGLLGKALFLRAGIETDGATAEDDLTRGVNEFRTAAMLYPTSAEMWAQYGNALEKAGSAIRRAGDPGRGNALVAQGKKAQAKAKEIQAYKARTHTGLTG